MELKQLLNNHALPLLAGVIITVINQLLGKYPVVTEWTGLSEPMISTAVTAILVYLIGLMDMQWSKNSWWTSQTVDPPQE